MNTQISDKEIKAIVGLGNPGPMYAHTPHNIGFLILDRLAKHANAIWDEKQNMQQASMHSNDKDILLIKPQTYMNNSGEILKFLNKRGIKIENIFVIHDEIDFAFGKISLKDGGSARGHNGLRSLIAHGGENFLRLRCGVGRPDNPAEVGNFVTAPFQQSEQEIDSLINKAVDNIQSVISK